MEAKLPVTNGTATPTLTKADFETDQEVRWCPGCGTRPVLAAVQKLMPTLGIPREKTVFISGIGCSSRFPYYMNTYGFHTIHGRAPGIATGVKLSNPDLSVWVITGDGDALSIGGNHFIHLLRRNVDLNILLFNNRIYGLTKGQDSSPTSEVGKVTKSTPFGSADFPLNPVLVALGAQASFVARAVDRDAQQMAEVLAAASKHRGTSLVEIYQNCNIFNDGAFEYVAERSTRSERQLHLVNGQPLVFGKEKNRGIRISNLRPEIIEFDPKTTDAITAGVTVYDSTNPNLANLIARLDYPDFPVPMGVFYQDSRQTFDGAIVEQAKQSLQKSPLKGSIDDNLRDIFNSGDTWVVS